MNGGRVTKKANWSMIGALVGAAALLVAYVAAKSTLDAWLASVWAAMLAPAGIPRWLLLLMASVALGLLAAVYALYRKTRAQLLLTHAELPRVGDPGEDGLYRRDGKPFCPECLRTKGVVYYLKSMRSSGGSVGTVGGPMTRLPDCNVGAWKCSVCESEYHES